MISEDQLKRVAAWSRELTPAEIEVARAGITERSYGTGETVFMRGDKFDYWAGMVSGLARMGGVSRDGKETSLAGLTAGAWFGEGSVLKNEPRRYDVVALRDSRVALMERSAFMWLFENSVGFNRFLVRQLNERLGQFIGMLEVNRTLERHLPACPEHCLAVQPDPLSGINRASGDHPGGNRRALRHVAPERQPRAEPAGEGGTAAARIWRRHDSQYRSAARIWRLRRDGAGPVSPHWPGRAPATDPRASTPRSPTSR
ncbi:CRP-like cAMP-binding protein [Bradyrhizobium sp. GM24.11]